MMRSSSPITNHDGSSRHRGCSPGRCEERLLRRRPLRRRHPRCLRRRHVGAEQVVEAVLDDVQVGRAVAARNRLQRVLAEHAAGEQPGQREAALTGIGCEAVHVDEPGDLAGVCRHVRDHRSAVGVGDEHDRPFDRADEVADARGVGGQVSQRVGRGDHGVPGARQRVDDAVPARRFGERAVDENDCGFHETLLWVAATWLSQSSKWVGAMRASSPGVSECSSSSAPK